MRLEHFVPAQTGHQTHYLYRHLSMPMHLWPVHLHRLTAASLQELRNQCLTSKHNMCSPQHNVLHVLWMGSEINQTGSVCVCVCSCLFPNIFGDTSLHSPEWVLTPSLAFQKDLACFCCLLCWHHFSEISKKQLTSYCCMCFEENGVLHIASRTCLELSSTNQHHVHCL